MPLTRSINVGIIESDDFLLKSYNDFLKDYGDINISFAVNSMTAFGQIVKRRLRDKPNIILLGVEANLKIGLDAIRILHFQFPGVRVIILSSEETDAFIMQALRTGASSILFKRFGMVEIFDTIIKVNEHGAFLHPEISARIMNYMRSSMSKEITDKLTPKEIELVLLLSKGLSYQEVAEQLKISTYAVTYRMRRIHEKLNITSKAQLLSLVRKGSWQ